MKCEFADATATGDWVPSEGEGFLWLGAKYMRIRVCATLAGRLASSEWPVLNEEGIVQILSDEHAGFVPCKIKFTSD